jgi:hypothetical protein
LIPPVMEEINRGRLATLQGHNHDAVRQRDQAMMHLCQQMIPSSLEKVNYVNMQFWISRERAIRAELEEAN